MKIQPRINSMTKGGRQFRGDTDQRPPGARHRTSPLWSAGVAETGVRPSWQIRPSPGVLQRRRGEWPAGREGREPLLLRGVRPVYRARNDVTVNAPKISDSYLSGIVLSDKGRAATDKEEGTTIPVNQINIRDPSVTFLAPGAHEGGKPEANGIFISSGLLPAGYRHHRMLRSRAYGVRREDRSYPGNDRCEMAPHRAGLVQGRRQGRQVVSAAVRSLPPRRNHARLRTPADRARRAPRGGAPPGGPRSCAGARGRCAPFRTRSVPSDVGISRARRQQRPRRTTRCRNRPGTKPDTRRPDCG